MHEKVFSYPQSDKQGKVLIVDRDAMCSGLLADTLTRELDYDAVASRASTALEMIASGKVEVVIISAELNSKPGGGFELANAISTANPSLPIVILLDEPSRESVIMAFRSGGRGVFNRQEPVCQLLECVEHVRRGLIWAGGGETNYLLEAFKSIPTSSAFAEGKLAALSMRELQVVKSAARGKTNKVIATELCLSVHTVKNYLFRAFEKLGVSSRVELLFFLTTRGQLLSMPAPVREPLRLVE